MELKEGDIVTIHKGSRDIMIKSNNWTDSMQSCEGKTGYISSDRKQGKGHWGYHVRFDNGQSWFFNEECFSDIQREQLLELEGVL